MRVSVCVGDYATTPYCIPGLELNVYSMEELCYCIKENAFLLDFSLMNDSLIDWIERQCGLKNLARELYQLAHKNGSLSAFGMTILAYTGLYDEGVIRETGQVLKKGAGLSSLEKRKSQIDHLVRQKKFLTALRGYDQLLESWGEFEQDKEQPPAASTRAAILHNKGVAFAGLMLYGRAAACFREAYQISGAEDDYTEYLAAKRMELPEGDYVALAAENAGNYQCVLQLEKKLEQLTRDWESQPEYLRLYNRRELRGTDRQRYQEESDSLAQALKSSYRKGL